MVILRPKNCLKISLFTGIILFVLGFAGTLPTLYYDYSRTGTALIPDTTSQTAINNSTVRTSNAPAVIEGLPIRISIPDLNMDLSIIPGYYNHLTGTWTLTDIDAQYATPSVLPNNIAGNTLIYGHYRRQVFSNLHLIKPGSHAIITTNNGYQLTYKYTGTFAVNPTDVSVFSSTGLPRLTVQTCSGDWFQNRQMYQFTYLGYIRI